MQPSPSADTSNPDLPSSRVCILNSTNWGTPLLSHIRERRFSHSGFLLPILSAFSSSLRRRAAQDAPPQNPPTMMTCSRSGIACLLTLKRDVFGGRMAALSLCIGRWFFRRRPRRQSTAALGLGRNRRKQGIDFGHHPDASALRPGPWGRNGAVAKARLSGSASRSGTARDSGTLAVGLAENRSGVVSVGRLVVMR